MPRWLGLVKYFFLDSPSPPPKKMLSRKLAYWAHRSLDSFLFFLFPSFFLFCLVFCVNSTENIFSIFFLLEKSKHFSGLKTIPPNSFVHIPTIYSFPFFFCKKCIFFLLSFQLYLHQKYVYFSLAKKLCYYYHHFLLCFPYTSLKIAIEKREKYLFLNFAIFLPYNLINAKICTALQQNTIYVFLFSKIFPPKFLINITQVPTDPSYSFSFSFFSHSVSQSACITP